MHRDVCFSHSRCDQTSAQHLYVFVLILCWQEGSDSEKATKEPEVIARKFKKIPKTKVLIDSSRDDAKHKPAGSSHGCLALLKNKGDGICSLANYILEMK